MCPVGTSDWSVEVSGGEEDQYRGRSGGYNNRRRYNDDDQTVLDRAEASSVTSPERGMSHLNRLQYNTLVHKLF